MYRNTINILYDNTTHSHESFRHYRIKQGFVTLREPLLLRY